MKTYNLKQKLDKMETVSYPTQVRNRYKGYKLFSVDKKTN